MSSTKSLATGLDTSHYFAHDGDMQPQPITIQIESQVLVFPVAECSASVLFAASNGKDVYSLTLFRSATTGWRAACNCPSARYRGMWACKHALKLVELAEAIEAATIEAAEALADPEPGENDGMWLTEIYDPNSEEFIDDYRYYLEFWTAEHEFDDFGSETEAESICTYNEPYEVAA